MRERAVDALSKIGSPKALPKLEAMLGQNPKPTPSFIRAISKIGDTKHIANIVPMLKRSEREIQIEAIKALVKHSPTKRMRRQRSRRAAKRSSSRRRHDHQYVADGALKDLDARFSAHLCWKKMFAPRRLPKTRARCCSHDDDLDKAAQRGEEASKVAGPRPGHEEAAVCRLGRHRDIPAAAEARLLDISTLNPGDVLDGRYKYIEKIGKGAFGTVLLMEDEVVDERLFSSS